MEVGYGSLEEPVPTSPQQPQKDQKLLKNGNNVEKTSGKAWGRVKNILTRRARYPPSIFFILGTEFCERFCYYGLRTILVLYLTNWLRFSPDSATAIYHGSSMLAYFSPILGAVIADGYIGRYRTILYLSVVYCIGNLILALTALPPREKIGPLIGLFVIGLGTGGIKPCVSAFGGDQFHASQEKERTTFFSVFYFMINVGSVLSTFFTPMLRADVHCIEDTCYPLAFGVPALLMFLAIIIFIAGTKLYKRNPPSGNILGKVLRCIWHGLRRSCQTRGEVREDKTHWLDRAEDKFEESFVEDVKILLKVLWLFLPLPLFWALFDQQGSRWTLQAEEMDGSMGSLGRLKPDQFQVLNPLLIIVLIPVFEHIIYPLLDCCRLPHRPLQRMVVGMSFGVLAFIVAGLVQIKLDAGKEAPLATGESGITVINTIKCNISLTSPFYTGNISTHQYAGMYRHQSGSMSVSAACEQDKTSSVTDTFLFDAATPYRIVIMTDSQGHMTLKQFLDKRTKPSNGQADVSVVSNLPYTNSSQRVRLVPMKEKEVAGTPVYLNISRDNATAYTSMEPAVYKVSLPLQTPGDTWKDQAGLVTVLSGATYTLALVNKNSAADFNDEADVTVYQGLAENQVSMFLLVPQYVIITIGEVLFSVTGLSFAYSQAPNGLKSVVQAAWLLTTAVGDLVVVIVAEVQLLPSQTAEFFLFAALMGVATIIFSIMTLFYKYLYVTSSASGSDTDEAGLVDEDKEEIPLKDKDGKQA
ncbi:solute carrier family 15 member 1-like isoform X1 [Haliotis rufescens]|uniref:solute carrier family 15 member 1-like isoform X1 n=1 Tax=Haliotis rufescens TaxID=6454 RepID=UPI00201ED11E|nr:solute carrier family 15 member 1-like isoform X1 [Haliotis rufescens]